MKWQFWFIQEVKSWTLIETFGTLFGRIMLLSAKFQVEKLKSTIQILFFFKATTFSLGLPGQIPSQFINLLRSNFNLRSNWIKDRSLKSHVCLRGENIFGLKFHFGSKCFEVISDFKWAQIGIKVGSKWGQIGINLCLWYNCLESKLNAVVAGKA